MRSATMNSRTVGALPMCSVFSSLLVVLLTLAFPSEAFVPLLDGGKEMPKLYDGWFNEQIVKQASTAIGKAVGAGKVSHAHE